MLVFLPSIFERTRVAYLSNKLAGCLSASMVRHAWLPKGIYGSSGDMCLRERERRNRERRREKEKGESRGD